MASEDSERDVAPIPQDEAVIDVSPVGAEYVRVAPVECVERFKLSFGGYEIDVNGACFGEIKYRGTPLYVTGIASYLEPGEPVKFEVRSLPGVVYP